MPASLISPAVREALAVTAAVMPPGCFVEVGVYQGGSATYLYAVAERQGRNLYLYDTFTGMPHCGEWDRHPVGEWADCSVEAVRAACPRAIITEGIFPESLVPMEPIAFAHVDCDAYESVKACIEHLWPLVVRGGVMWFDDYGDGDCPGATKAVDECFGERIERMLDGKVLVRK